MELCIAVAIGAHTLRVMFFMHTQQHRKELEALVRDQDEALRQFWSNVEEVFVGLQTDMTADDNSTSKGSGSGNGTRSNSSAVIATTTTTTAATARNSESAPTVTISLQDEQQQQHEQQQHAQQRRPAMPFSPEERPSSPRGSHTGVHAASLSSTSSAAARASPLHLSALASVGGGGGGGGGGGEHELALTRGL